MSSENNLSDATIAKLEIIAQEARRTAKQARKQFKSPTHERENKFISEEANLRMVIGELKKRLGSTDDGSLSERGLQLEIGDCFGVLGGLYRDWEKFDDAASCYHEGHQCEARVEELGGKSNSYCLVQELVNRLLSDPSRLQDLDFKKLLDDARIEVQRQISNDRVKDIWAKADLALLCLLISPEDSIQQWDEFDDLTPPRFAYDGTLDVVLALYERLEGQIAESELLVWKDTISRLDLS